MPKLPYFQFYPDDYLSSPGVTTCDLIDEGIYVRLLAYSWKHDGCQLPYDMKYLRRLCKGARSERIESVINRHFEKVETIPGKFFIRNFRIYTEFSKACGVSGKRSYAANVRWNKETGDATALQVDMQKGMQNDAIPDIRYQIPEEPKIIVDKPIRKTFEVPAVGEVEAYCRLERGNSVDAEKFVAFYESNGWRVGKNPMKDWRAAVRTWEKNTITPKAAVGSVPGYRKG